MQLADVLDVLSSINGCTFASIDAETEPTKGIRKVTTGESIIVFTNKTGSGYEKMVRRRLAALGKNPDNFVLSDLPWGERIPDTPLIFHKDRYYIQTILLHEGETHYYLLDREINPLAFGIRARRTNQGLPRGDEVVVNTYALSSITALRILGQHLPKGD